MDIARLVLDFLKVLLSAQVVAGAVAVVFFAVFREDIKALMRRVAKIRFPGGGEVSTSQAERSSEVPATSGPTPTVPPGEQVALPQNLTLTPEQVEQLRQMFQAERARAYLWEYRYLNYFLVAQTQRVLDWLASLKEPPSYELYDTMLIPAIPSAEERKAIVEALQAHHLIQIKGNLLEATPKGQEYIQWRGPLPSSAT